VILVVGGTGNLGRRLVPSLVARGLRVRVLTRDRARASGLPAGIETCVGDLRREADLAAALTGCTGVVSAAHGFAGEGGTSPEAIDRDANLTLLRLARVAGVERFVLVSVVGARSDHPMSLFRAKHAAEEALRASGLRFTIVRSTAFMETWISVVGAPLESGKALVFGKGENPINFVSARDVAALIAECLRDESTVNQTLEIGGPEDLGFSAFAQRLLAARNPAGRVDHVPLPALRAMSILARPFSPEFARKAGAAVVMNTHDMTFASAVRQRFPEIPNTTLSDLLRAE
jgi:NADH dehydrogenase